MFKKFSQLFICALDVTLLEDLTMTKCVVNPYEKLMRSNSPLIKPRVTLSTTSTSLFDMPSSFFERKAPLTVSSDV